MSESKELSGHPFGTRSLSRVAPKEKSRPAVQKALQVAAAQFQASLRKVEAPVPALVEPERATPAGPQIIRIVGLDEGPREIVLPPPPKSPIACYRQDCNSK